MTDFFGSPLACAGGRMSRALVGGWLVASCLLPLRLAGGGGGPETKSDDTARTKSDEKNEKDERSLQNN
mgnify:CR=1 FL=1